MDDKPEPLKDKNGNPLTVPAAIGGWGLWPKSSEEGKIYLYECHGIMCSITKQDAGWQKHYGTIKPVGASIRKVMFPTLEEALADWNYRKKK